MIEYRTLYEALNQGSLTGWGHSLPAQLENIFEKSGHGDLPRWKHILDQLPSINPTSINLSGDTITIGNRPDCPDEAYPILKRLLKDLHPWRKGPYSLFGIYIDCEWRSDLKWKRLDTHIQPLRGRLVLDVGCGNGYHCWRMYGAGAKLVVGIDPSLLSVMQFHAIRHFVGKRSVYVLPIGIEDVPTDLKAFNTVFSMGVLYHRRSPLDHLIELRGCLVEGGELILETLVMDGGLGQCLVPENRYAKMRNVWFIPSCPTLMSWMKRCGYENIRLVSVESTTFEEQRSTEWMRFQSLSDFLDKDNPVLTCEGFPAPKRAIFLATSPVT